MTNLRAELRHLENQAGEYGALAREAIATIEHGSFARITIYFHQLASELTVPIAVTEAGD